MTLTASSNLCVIVKAKVSAWPATESLDLSACYAALGEDAVDGVGESPSLANNIIHSVRYVGSMNVGPRGDMSHIPEAIEFVLAENPSPSHYMPVRVRLGEACVFFCASTSLGRQYSNIT